MKYRPKYAWLDRLVWSAAFRIRQHLCRDIDRKEEQCREAGWYCVEILPNTLSAEETVEIWFHPSVEISQFISDDWVGLSQLDATKELIHALRDDQWLVFSDEDYSFIMGEETR